MKLVRITWILTSAATHFNTRYLQISWNFHESFYIFSCFSCFRVAFCCVNHQIFIRFYEFLQDFTWLCKNCTKSSLWNFKVNFLKSESSLWNFKVNFWNLKVHFEISKWTFRFQKFTLKFQSELSDFKKFTLKFQSELLVQFLHNHVKSCKNS